MPRLLLSDDEAKLIAAHRRARKDYADAFNAGISRALKILEEVGMDYAGDSESLGEAAAKINSARM